MMLKILISREDNVKIFAFFIKYEIHIGYNIIYLYVNQSRSLQKTERIISYDRICI